MGDATAAEDRLLGGTVRLLQRPGGHRAGTDAVLLAALSGARDGDRVVDLGAATGAVGLMVARRARLAALLFLERDPDLVALCRRNIALNGLDGVAIAEAVDVFREPPGAAETADLVVTNPPFFGRGEPASPDRDRRAAHHMAAGDLSGWLAGAARRLRHRGRLAMIHRADALPDCLQALAPRFGSVEVVPIQPQPGAEAGRIVLRAVKGGRAAFRLRPALVLHGPDGGFTPEAASLHGAPA